MKKILVINYSQSGQLDEILDNFLVSFEGAAEIERVSIKPKDEYPFPWTSPVFFNVMPECVLEEKTDLAPYQLGAPKYDLIILGYQPWFLSPSLPVTALLQDPKFLSVLKDTPVVTVIGARNMWINSQKSVVQRITDAGGKMVANVPLIDRHQNLISVLTIFHWMLGGKKTRKWGFLPFPGVSEEDIKAAATLGKPVSEAIQKGSFEGVQRAILAYNKIDLHPSIMLIEARGKPLFNIWARLIKKQPTDKKRSFRERLFKWYLMTALFVVSPIVLTIYNLLVRPFTGNRIKRNKEQFLYLGIDK